MIQLALDHHLPSRGELFLSKFPVCSPKSIVYNVKFLSEIINEWFPTVKFTFDQFPKVFQLKH